MTALSVRNQEVKQVQFFTSTKRLNKYNFLRGKRQFFHKPSILSSL